MFKKKGHHCRKLPKLAESCRKRAFINCSGNCSKNQKFVKSLILIMATVKFYLDTRKSGSDPSKRVSLKIAINHHSKTSFILTDIRLLPNQWDKMKSLVVDHPQKRLLNRIAQSKIGAVNNILLELYALGETDNMTARELCYTIKHRLYPDNYQLEPKSEEDEKSFFYWFVRFTERKSGRTKQIYLQTLNRLEEWIGADILSSLKFEDIKISWLEDFESFLSQKNTLNSISIHMRNIRAVVNYAIDNDITEYYAFRRYRIKSEKTRKRNFKVETLRKIFTHECSDENEQKYLDYFKLTFMLIGINVVDMFGLTEVKNGRIDYIRAKTHRPYSIKVESEALSIIDKYRGTKRLLNFTEGCSTYRHFYNTLIQHLHVIKSELGLDELTTYWARHSWATIARKIGIDKDTIALALGHGSHTVTDIYIEEDIGQVDTANRKVLDFVLYGVLPKR